MFGPDKDHVQFDWCGTLSQASYLKSTLNQFEALKTVAEVAKDKNKRRLDWLHEGDMKDKGGYEWGVFRVKWENGKAVDVLQTLSDFSDLDKAIEAEMEQQKP